LLRLDGERRGEEDKGASDERSPIHYWITSSARASTAGGMVRPRALAVLRLNTMAASHTRSFPTDTRYVPAGVPRGFER
jgi:hypothetical protein